MKKAKRAVVIGRNDIVDLPELALFGIRAKVDTGAYTSALHCSRIRIIEKEGVPMVSFQLSGAALRRKKMARFETSHFEQRKIKSSTGYIETRVVIKASVVIFKKKLRTEFSLTDRSTMKFPILLGRKFLKKGFLVDVSKENLSYALQLANQIKKDS